MFWAAATMPSSPISLAPMPASLKPIAHFLKTATEHETRDPIVTYWCRLSALQTGLSLDKKSKEALALLLPLMDWLEKEKKVLSHEEAVTSEVVASAYIENYALKLFMWADKEDRNARFGKNVVKAFYSAGILYDVLQVFGELSPENAHARKYSKWKAAHIHSCLKKGETPIAGPVKLDDDDDDDVALEGAGTAPPPRPEEPGPSGWLQPQIPSVEPQAPVPAPRQVPSAPAAASVPVVPPLPAAASGSVSLTPDLTSKAQKYCKYAASALDYEDGATAIANLTKALNLLQTGKEN